MPLPCFVARPLPAPGLPRCELGEGATWSVARQALLWTDITGRRLWSYAPATQGVRHWPLPERLGSFALSTDPDWLLLALAQRLAWLNLESGELQALAQVQSGEPVRCNDGRCDRAGHFVFGTLDEQRGPQAQGRWWRYSAAGELAPLDLPPVAIANGLAWSPDGQRLYFCDSPEQRLRMAGYEARTGRLVHPQVFAPVHTGEPDGATVDAQGRYWSAHWGAGAVVAYQPDGQVAVRVELPVSQPSCVAFGGPQLRTLFITTARQGLSAAQLAEEPEAGALHAVNLPWAGLPEPLYGGRVPGA